MKKQLTLLQGLPASGKSTWSKKRLSEDKNIFRINKDLLREMCHFSKYSKGRERLIEDARDALILLGMSQARNIIVDDTNFNPRHAAHIKKMCEENDYTFSVMVFTAGPETCKRRDSRRHKRVGDRVINEMYLKAKLEGGIKFKEFPDDSYTPDEKNPKAIIFDVDGTLARMGDRSPYEGNKVHLDTSIQPTIDILKMYEEKGHEIIVFTGREGTKECRELTEQRLAERGIHPTHFAIRAEGDQRCDSIVKREMFDKVSSDYNIEAVFDDRDRVIAMWRGMGIQTFQVNYGNF